MNEGRGKRILVTLRVPEDLAAAYEAKAIEYGMSRNSLMVLVMALGLEQFNKLFKKEGDLDD